MGSSVTTHKCHRSMKYSKSQVENSSSNDSYMGIETVKVRPQTKEMGSSTRLREQQQPSS